MEPKKDIEGFSDEIASAQHRVTALHRETNEIAIHKNGLLPELFAELQVSLEELRTAEEEMRQQNDELGETRLRVERERQRYRDLFDFAPDGYLVTDAEGNILEANRAAGVLLGVGPRYMTHKPLTVYVALPARTAFRSHMAQIRKETEAVKWETVLRSRDRGTFPAAVTVSAIRDSDQVTTGLRWLVRDITERKEWEARLRQINRDLERRVQERTAELEAAWQREQAARVETNAILESITDAFYALDEEFRFTYVNRQAGEWFSAAPGELIGRHIWTEFPGAIGSESHRQHLHAHDERKDVFYETVSALTGKWIEVHIYPRARGLCVYFRDISERKKVEQTERQTFEQTRRIADVLQTALLQTVSENAFPGLAVSTLYTAASDEALVGGDFFDAFTVDSGKVALVVGDISGKGLSAAAHITEIKFALRAYLRETPDLQPTLARLNEFVCESQRQDDWGISRFVVLALAVVDPATGDVDYTSAGAEPLLVLPPPGRPDDPAREVGARCGLVLGVASGLTYDVSTFTLAPGEMILMTTDGITEARREGRMLGLDGLKRLAVSGRIDASVGEISRMILEGAREFSGGHLTDDACILLAQRHPVRHDEATTSGR